MISFVPEAGIKGRDKRLHPTISVRYTHMSLPMMPASIPIETRPFIDVYSIIKKGYISQSLEKCF